MSSTLAEELRELAAWFRKESAEWYQVDVGAATGAECLALAERVEALAARVDGKVLVRPKAVSLYNGAEWLVTTNGRCANGSTLDSAIAALQACIDREEANSREHDAG